MEKYHMIVVLSGILLFLGGYLLGTHLSEGNIIQMRKSQVACITDKVACEVEKSDIELKIENLCDLKERLKVLPCKNLQICLCGRAEDMELSPNNEDTDNDGATIDLLNLDPWKDMITK